MTDGPDPRDATTAGGAIFVRLKALGIDYVFANSGTDFPPIIEGLARASADGIALPIALAIPHEHAAMGMAQGYWLATGRPQAVMLHTNVGLANGAIGAINMATDHVPVILMSGRTPVTEKGRFGARTVPIGWGQEMRDQAALVREACKWDYELRFPEQVGEVLDRAWAIATSTPTGPVYLALPREVLCEPYDGPDLARPPSMAPARIAPAGADIARAAELLAAAERPLVIAQRGCGHRAGFDALARLARDWAIPVCDYWACALAIAADHPMAVGADPMPWLAEADVVVVVDSLAPWAPDRHAPPADARVIQLGPDPLFARFPVRNFPSALSLACETGDGLVALEAAMRPLHGAHRRAVEARRPAVEARAQAIAAGIDAAAAEGDGTPMTKAWVSKCLGEALREGAGSGRRATVLSELGCPLGPLGLTEPDAWHQEPHSGGLGWSFPCAMGIQLADPGRLVVATMGDGAYLFSNPAACHQVAEALGLPVVVLILNNGEWGAVRQSVAGLYPEGRAATANAMPLTSLHPSPDFVKTAEASRAWAERVEDGADLPGAIARAMKVASEERRVALLDVRVAPER